MFVFKLKRKFTFEQIYMLLHWQYFYEQKVRNLGTVLSNGVKVAVSDQSQKCQKLTKVGLACSLQLN